MHPVLIEIGPISIRYYGLMYVLGILAAIFLIRSEVRRKGLRGLSAPGSTMWCLIGRSIANSCGRYRQSGEGDWPSMGG